jgi:hypothetical protein
MNKSTKTISLVLIGSALTLAGCSSSEADLGVTFDEDEPQNQVNHGHTGGHLGAGAGIYAASRILGRGVGGGGMVGAGVSARGGFGAPGGFSASS